MVVPRSRLSEVEDLAVEAAEGYTPGHALAEGTRLGPLVSSAQRDRVLAYIQAGQRDGAKLLTGGPERPEGLHRGFFVRPTVFSGVTPDMAIAREEIFGPVLSIIPYDGEDEAVAIANDSIYGLSAAVWASDLDHARHVAHRIRAGQVALNGGGFNPLAPFGGFKQSGYGREYGRYGLEEYLEVKAIHL
jgi:acyl-CoA reductase-like NAD-dependent aldehyde dehydrogenase